MERSEIPVTPDEKISPSWRGTSIHRPGPCWNEVGTAQGTFPHAGSGDGSATRRSRLAIPKGTAPFRVSPELAAAALAFCDKPFYMYPLQGERIAGEAICTIGTNGGWSWRSDYRRTRRTSRTTTGLSVLTTI